MVAFSKLPVMMSDEDIVDKRYENGKIYLVKCKKNPKLIYVGSTYMSLEERLKLHRIDKNCSLYKHVNGDWDNWYIELYEDYPCKNKYILRRREGEVQKQIATINKNIAGRTIKEWCEDNREKILEQQKQYNQDNREKIKQYYQDNREKILEQRKQYHQDNLEKISEYHKQYYQDNRDKLTQYRQNNREKIAEQRKQHYQANRDKIEEKKKQKITCDRCGSISTMGHIKRHQRTQKCLNYNVAIN